MAHRQATQRTLQSINTRKKLYDVCIELIREHGFDSVTIEDISKKAGVSVGAFYHHFSSKSDILHEIIAQIDEYFEKEVSNRLHGTSLDKINEYFRYYAEFIVDQGVDFIKQLFTTKNKLFIANNRYLMTCLKDLIVQGQQNKEIRGSQDAEEITDFFFILVRGVVFDWCLHDGSYDLKSTIENYIKRVSPLFWNQNHEYPVQGDLSPRNRL